MNNDSLASGISTDIEQVSMVVPAGVSVRMSYGPQAGPTSVTSGASPESTRKALKSARRALAWLKTHPRQCKRCKGPREKRFWYCGPCRKAMDKEIQARFWATPKGRAVRQRYVQSPQRKIQQANYYDKIGPRRALYGRRYRAKHTHIGDVIKCTTVLCAGTFIRNRFNGPRKFCDSCQRFFKRNPPRWLPGLNPKVVAGRTLHSA